MYTSSVDGKLHISCHIWNQIHHTRIDTHSSTVRYWNIETTKIDTNSWSQISSYGGSSECETNIINQTFGDITHDSIGWNIGKACSSCSSFHTFYHTHNKSRSIVFPSIEETFFILLC